MWSNDHGEKFPFAMSIDKAGSLEFIETGEVFRHFQAVSNELNSPKVLFCPSDTKRNRTADFARFNNANLSYFVGFDAKETRPQTILSGDRTITTNKNDRLLTGLVMLTNNAPVRWAPGLHTEKRGRGCGNLGLGDGSAIQGTDKEFQLQLIRGSAPLVRLGVP